MYSETITSKGRGTKSREVREQWGKLTDDDLDVIAGRRDHFLGRLQERYGLDRAEADEEWQKTIRF